MERIYQTNADRNAACRRRKRLRATAGDAARAIVEQLRGAYDCNPNDYGDMERDIASMIERAFMEQPQTMEARISALEERVWLLEKGEEVG